MALTEQGIARAREIIAPYAIENYTGQTVDFLMNTLWIGLTSFIEKDEDFVKFTQGTKYGAEFYQKWNELLRLIGIDYDECTGSLVAATRKFLDEQEQYNNMKLD